MSHRAIFFDRDGVLIEEKHYLHKPEDVVVFSDVGESLRRFQTAGFELFIVTNQSGVGRGYFTMEDVEKVNRRILDDLTPYGVGFRKIYIAPEAPDQPSRGRKPSPAFLHDAQAEFQIDLAKSYMMGDKLIDLECGWNAGIGKSVLIRTGYGAKTESEHRAQLSRALVFDNLKSAADFILRGES